MCVRMGMRIRMREKDSTILSTATTVIVSYFKCKCYFLGKIENISGRYHRLYHVAPTHNVMYCFNHFRNGNELYEEMWKRLCQWQAIAIVQNYLNPVQT